VHSADRCDEVLGRGVLQQEAGCTGLDGTHDVTVGVEGGQNEYVHVQIGVGDVTTFLAERETAAADEAISKGLLDKAQGRVEDIVKKQVNAVLGEQASKYEVRVVLPPPPAQ